MTRFLAAMAALFLSIVAVSARAESVDDLRRGLAEMRAGDWNAALSQSGARGSVTRDVIVWHWLRQGFGTDGDVLVFLERRPDWPGLDWLRLKSEPSFTNAAPERVLEFYDGHPPETAEGALNYATALLAQGLRGDAEAEIVKAWRTLAMGDGLQASYLENFGELLKPHHVARLDRMLWDGHVVSARRMLPLVDEGRQKLAQARLALHEMVPGVDARIEAVPEELVNSPGLAFARFVWRDRKEFDDSAVDLMLERSVSAESLGEPAAWADARRRLARLTLRNGDPQRAYETASSHFTTPENGYDYSDLEWLSGFIALRMLDRPEVAARHFERFAASVESPISMGRAGYWMGRAYAAAGDADKAHAAYALGAENQTSFYGLLAAERIGRPFDAELADPPQNAPWREAAFTGSSVFQAGQMLLELGEDHLAERFLTHLVESLDREQALQLGDAVLELGDAHLGVMVAKRAARSGLVIPAAYYPVHPVAEMPLPMAKEMTLAIARRESEFDPVVISGAGARGLMQVMPATARLVAQELGILGGHATDRLTADWEYNAKLGANYLAQLAGDLNGNVVMMSAGYNAGPRRPLSWMNRFGDPRSGEIDIIDWIELIPFSETRNYVMRVTESLPVYRARLGKEPLPVPFSQELLGSTLLAFAP
ncbi:lytic transglycosylase domain-containing protein [Lutimaribacter marinistellae]|uniref:Lytic transglycosylase domain-containing protein n=1 Tax=Lutimaribacter marinistellae TaxID=1820329 RepID=A0ABV7TAJ8_9RHOB